MVIQFNSYGDAIPAFFFHFACSESALHVYLVGLLVSNAYIVNTVDQNQKISIYKSSFHTFNKNIEGVKKREYKYSQYLALGGC